MKHGVASEKELRLKFKEYGCVIQSDEELDHEHKLDLVITKFPEIQKFCSVGVQVTTMLDQFKDQEKFFELHKQGFTVEKAIYLEISPKVNLDKGGALTAYVAILSFLMDSSYEEEIVTCLRIQMKDQKLTYHFYLPKHDNASESESIPTREIRKAWFISEVEKDKVKTTIGSKLEGQIYKYYHNREFGFIRTPDYPDFWFHFHVRGFITDTKLKIILSKISNRDSTNLISSPIKVDFVNAGFRLNNEDENPVAKNIRICTHTN